MEPVILRVAQTVEIQAPPTTVFALAADAPTKARFNPFVEVIRVERETPGPLREGSVTFFRLQKGQRIFEYRMRCARLVPGRIIQSQADLPTLFRVTIEVEPASGGCRLIQREECEVTRDMLEGLLVPRRAERAWRVIKLFHLFMPGLTRDAYAVLLQERIDALHAGLKRELSAWLRAIKDHLESGASGLEQTAEQSGR
jgi:hypothetical protein